MALTFLRMSGCVPSHVCDKNGSEEENVLLIGILNQNGASLWKLSPKFEN